jgi:sigma-B regulation protein RsbU (phosphoserine phosphatase)
MIDQELRDTSQRGMFVTMIVGLYDPQSQYLRLANAGHEPPLLREADGRFVDCDQAGRPLGLPSALAQPPVYDESEFDLTGRSLYIFSDGVTEWRIDHGRMLGRDGLIRVLNSLAGDDAPDRLARIADAVRGATEPPHDDFTLLVVEERRQSHRRAPA